MIVWIVGLSGAGKTTIGREVYALWKQRDPATVLVDGDEIRAIVGADREGAYTIAARRQNAERLASLCAWLDTQEINAVCCALCIFPDVLAGNRKRFRRYFEVFVDAPMSRLEERDSKGLYAAARAGKTSNVVGVDIPFPRPSAADFVVDNSGAALAARSIAGDILRRMDVLPTERAGAA